MIWMFCTHYSFTKEVSSGETPVESQEEIPHILLPWFPGTLPDRIEGMPVYPDHCGHILRRFHAPFDLQGFHGEPDQLIEALIGAEIAGGEAVGWGIVRGRNKHPVIPIPRPMNEMEGLPARLGTPSPVSTPSTDGGGEKTLA
jgi:hypothetical protein